MPEELKVDMNELMSFDEQQCERGGVLLVGDDGDFNAWLKLAGDYRLEVIWKPSNYPALTAQLVRVSDAELWAHVKKHCGGMTVRKLNLDVPELAGRVPAWVPDESGESDDPMEE